MEENRILDWNEYIKTARSAAAEGAVLLKNEGNVLPFQKGSCLAVFGRMQNHYYKSGTGSGGMVNVSKVWSIPEALLEGGEVTLHEGLLEIYRRYDETHPYDDGVGFGNEPWSQEEMPVEEETVRRISREADAALVIIGRTAGEEQDNQNRPGSYLLTETETDLLRKVRAAFARMVLVLNVGSIVDLSVIGEIAPDAICYAWQGGMVGALGTADVLTGRVSPSGRLTDTIAKDISDYPAYGRFGDTVRNFYEEDIYVGYRYFETFAKEKVLYPFGFGLSYTSFSVKPAGGIWTDAAAGLLAGRLTVSVQNTGGCAGKEVVQVYVREPQGLLGKPAVRLIAYAKTETLQPGESQTLEIPVEPPTFASYDDSGVTGNRYCYVLEAGEYRFYLGRNARELTYVDGFTLEQTKVLERLSQAMAPTLPFSRIRPELDGEEYRIAWEPVPLATETEEEHIRQDLPGELPFTGDQGICLKDVRDKKASMSAFISQLSDEDLSCIVRGEGMGSPKVTPGTAAAFGGVSPGLKTYGIPCGCCSDGPSGMRLDCGTKAFSLPNGTLLACTWNEALNTRLYHLLGLEMTANRVDVLLGPGMNLHRYPLNGRNFEYFSEDPLVTGKTAAAQIRGLRSAGVTGTLKHFCGNNQELNRHGADSVISERALRELYLKGFEIAVKEAGANSVMTTYGPVNGIWTNTRYDLNTKILRGEWGFQGIVMTDWWANIGKVGGKISRNDFAALVRAQNDFYAVCPDASVNTENDNTLASLADHTLTRGQLQRNAANICAFLMDTNAMKRMAGEKAEVEIVGRPQEEETFDVDSVVYYPVQDGTVIPLEHVDTQRGKSYVFALDVSQRGGYYFEITGKSDLSELAQIPVSFYFQSILGGVFTWNGTAGEWVSKKKKLLLTAKYGIVRLYFGGSGLKLRDIRFTFEKPLSDVKDWSEYMWG